MAGTEMDMVGVSKNKNTYKILKHIKAQNNINLFRM